MDNPQKETGALENFYTTEVFMLRQAQHERFLDVLLSTAPFALSRSKGEQRRFQRSVTAS
jgi:hypothetical protein